MTHLLTITLRRVEGGASARRFDRRRVRRFPWEFHIRKDARVRFGVPNRFFAASGNVILADFRAVRLLAKKMNDSRDETAPPIRAGQLNAMGLIDEILHFVFRLYELTVNPGVLERGLSSAGTVHGPETLGNVFSGFTESFPPLSVHRGGETVRGYLEGETDGRPHAEVTLEELLMLHLANVNPAFRPFAVLFDDAELAASTAYAGVIAVFREFLRTELPFGESGESVVDFLEAPMRAHPDSLPAQLAYMKERWGMILSGELMNRILSSSDLIREDEKKYPDGGAGVVTGPFYPAPGTADEYPERENFTRDTDWMPNIVLLAKNVYVWFHQLSSRYGRQISRLDQIPDEELGRLRKWNFTSLWLIGVWERSRASEKIKKMAGNPEAAPSAYSLHDYEIASDLGGEQSFDNLARRAWEHGIRLAADMVPNHTGITSRWMKEHPDYFMQSDGSPFPSYRFTGIDLSDDPSYQVRIEDGYWTRSDAAVVFQYIDNGTGRLRYIYHGNDGTNMPWNDTAQLDFLRAEVREAVIGRILQVARKFSVIRFDAAMTLTRKHFQRLWYPPPGSGGDIPSRADNPLRADEFSRMFPEEFWREVVDRVNREMPQTLLLAEAFWLLEGYFVRTLGMHRVYNSAFMHMLMKEDNAQYRSAITNTLRYNPEILKRYVNFMSNPDEKTAIEQFGSGDKYFGVATLMATLPGLPMFAHGQIEGFREKYGMEYRRSYHQESPDEELVRRHEREIFPLLGMRSLFSQTDNFEFYDVVGTDGNIIEDIFAYSNMVEGRRAFVCYNNRYQSHAGRIRLSVGKSPAGDDPGGKGVRSLTLSEALGLENAPGTFIVFREFRSGLEYIRPGHDFSVGGFSIQLGGYHCQVFLDFKEVRDPDGSYARLCQELDGSGVPDVSRSRRAMTLRPIHHALRELFTPVVLGEFSSSLKNGRRRDKSGGILIEKFRELVRTVRSFSPDDGREPGGGSGRELSAVASGRGESEGEELLRNGVADLGRLINKPVMKKGKGRPRTGGESTGAAETPSVVGVESAGRPDHLTGLSRLTQSPAGTGILLGWLLTDVLVEIFQGPATGDVSDSSRVDRFFERFHFGDGLTVALRPIAGEEFFARRHALIVRLLVKGKGHLLSVVPPDWQRSLYRFLREELVREAIGVNQYHGVRYFHKESFSEIMGYFVVISLYYGGREAGYSGGEWTALRDDIVGGAAQIQSLAGTLDYRYDGLMDFISNRGIPRGE